MTTRAAARLVAVACLMLAVPVTRANSEDDHSLSANAIMPGCEGFLSPRPQPSYLHGLCIGVVEGVSTTAQIAGRLCIPDGVIGGQAVRVVIQFINARPARMHERFSALAFEALTAAWPCKK